MCELDNVVPIKKVHSPLKNELLMLFVSTASTVVLILLSLWCTLYDFGHLAIVRILFAVTFMMLLTTVLIAIGMWYRMGELEKTQKERLITHERISSLERSQQGDRKHCLTEPFLDPLRVEMVNGRNLSNFAAAKRQIQIEL